MEPIVTSREYTFLPISSTILAICVLSTLSSDTEIFETLIRSFSNVCVGVKKCILQQVASSTFLETQDVYVFGRSCSPSTPDYTSEESEEEKTIKVEKGAVGQAQSFFRMDWCMAQYSFNGQYNL
jgi:hypothetical protein